MVALEVEVRVKVAVGDAVIVELMVGVRLTVLVEVAVATGVWVLLELDVGVEL